MYSLGIAYLLWALSGFGALGFHRFYLGKIPTGLLWMCTAGLGGFGCIYDLLTLPRQVQDANIRRNLHAQFYDAYTRPNTGHAARERGWRTVDDGDVRIVRENDSIEKQLLRLAKENRGILSLSQAALETDSSIDQVRKELEALVSKGIAEIRVKSSGTIVYTFPEFMDEDAPLESF
ncbi:MAG: TM2 domain-containing protein [Spirochaetaceae bacterium]|nr:TM2 domain-containing protein [Spirochaetaceae bacterium]